MTHECLSHQNELLSFCIHSICYIRVILSFKMFPDETTSVIHHGMMSWKVKIFLICNASERLPILQYFNELITNVVCVCVLD